MAFFTNNFSFRDRTFVRWIQWFSWFRTVIRLVHSVQRDCKHFFASRFGLGWCSVDQRLDLGEWHVQDGFLNLLQHLTAINSFWTGNGLHFSFCWSEEQLANSCSTISLSSRETRQKREKCENLPPLSNKKPPQQLILNSANYEVSYRLTARSKAHTPSSGRAYDINSPIELKLQFSICKTTPRFAGSSLLLCGLKASSTKICIRISLCKTSLLIFVLFVSFQNFNKKIKCFLIVFFRIKAYCETLEFMKISCLWNKNRHFINFPGLQCSLWKPTTHWGGAL